MLAAGPSSTWAPGPAASILKMMISKKTKEGGDLEKHNVQNAARGSLEYEAPGPARRILKMMISKQTKEGGDPLFTQV